MNAVVGGVLKSSGGKSAVVAARRIDRLPALASVGGAQDAAVIRGVDQVGILFRDSHVERAVGITRAEEGAHPGFVDIGRRLRGLVPHQLPCFSLVTGARHAE